MSRKIVEYTSSGKSLKVLFIHKMVSLKSWPQKRRISVFVYAVFFTTPTNITHGSYNNALHTLITQHDGYEKLEERKNHTVLFSKQRQFTSIKNGARSSIYKQKRAVTVISICINFPMGTRGCLKDFTIYQ